LGNCGYLTGTQIISLPPKHPGRKAGEAALPPVSQASFQSSLPAEGSPAAERGGISGDSTAHLLMQNQMLVETCDGCQGTSFIVSFFSIP
jgi:hypothetical protein